MAGPLSDAIAALVPEGVASGEAAEAAYWLEAVVAGLDTDASRGDEITTAARLSDLARRAVAFADGMEFGFLYDRERHLFAIGHRADAEGPRLDPFFYDLLASEARLASFVAITKGDVPDTHWFHLGRLLTSVDGSPTLLSWSA